MVAHGLQVDEEGAAAAAATKIVRCKMRLVIICFLIRVLIFVSFTVVGIVFF